MESKSFSSTLGKQVFPAPLFALTGGIASGKSTVSNRLKELGAVVIDSDLIAREVVEPGMPALTSIVGRFGESVLLADGRLDREALGKIVFSDAAARQDLNAILHPAIRERADLLSEKARMDGAAVIVHDIPLLAETRRGAQFALVATVEASEETRLRRMMQDRGMSREEAASRISAQASAQERREIADVVIVNDSSFEELTDQVDELYQRFEEFSRNVRENTPVHRRGPAILIPASERDWIGQGERLVNRIRAYLGGKALAVEHIGSTSVWTPDAGYEASSFAAKDVIDLQIELESLEKIPEILAHMAQAGFLQKPEITGDFVHGGLEEREWAKGFFANADPEQQVNIHVRKQGSAAALFAQAFRNELRESAEFRAEYLAQKRFQEHAHSQDLNTQGYAEAKEDWFKRVAWPRITP